MHIDGRVVVQQDHTVERRWASLDSDDLGNISSHDDESLRGVCLIPYGKNATWAVAKGEKPMDGTMEQIGVTGQQRDQTR